MSVFETVKIHQTKTKNGSSYTPERKENMTKRNHQRKDKLILEKEEMGKLLKNTNHKDLSNDYLV